MDSFVKDSKGRLIIDKDPEAVLDYVFDWSQYLSSVADTINEYDVRVTGSCAIDSKTESDGKVIAWVSGGTLNSVDSLTCSITTTGGRTDERTVYLKIKDR